MESQPSRCPALKRAFTLPPGYFWFYFFKRPLTDTYLERFASLSDFIIYALSNGGFVALTVILLSIVVNPPAEVPKADD